MSKRTGLPPMGALTAFESAYRHRGFTAAAEELSLTPAAIAHQVRLLEAWAGRPLFERRPNGVDLTEAGKEMGPRIQTLLDEVTTLGPQVRRQREVPQIVVRCQFSLAVQWLAPLVVEYAGQRPECQIVVRAEPAMADPLSGRADMAIYYSRTGISEVGYPLVGGRYIVVAAPTLLIALGVGSLDPRSIGEAPLINFIPKDRGWPEPTWASWCLSARHAARVAPARMSTSMMYVAIQMCVAGGGFALVHEPLVQAELADGRLVLASEISVGAPHNYSLIVRPISAMRKDVQSFSQWLLTNGTP
ncbi:MULTISPECIES: LysR substrate-binding domain-containing protein [unclassified Variovorax]|uniref:LysR substrate-binding domain-containing protein n=1 Tax=unclassified Variovorax TaxID=663243 RepID=UPI003F48B4A8